MSHTASVAGADRLVGDVMNRHGVIRARSTEELVRTVSLLNYLRANGSGLQQGGVAVIEGSGGAAAEAADRLSRNRVALASFNDRTLQVLADAAPSGAFIENPVDLTGSPKTSDVLRHAYETIYRDAGVAMVLVPWSLTFPGENEGREFHHDTLERYAALSRDTGKPTVVSSTNLHRWTNWMLEYRAKHPEVLVVRGLDSTAAALHHLVREGGRTIDSSSHYEVPTNNVLEESVGRSVLAQLHAPLVRGFVSEPPFDDLETQAAAMQPPFVVKVIADGVAHRTRIGGVIIGCRSAEELSTAGQRIVENVLMAGIDKDQINGLLVEEMVFGPELLVGFDRDRWYGPHVVLARGGINVEESSDSVVLPLPVADLESALDGMHFVDRSIVGSQVFCETADLIRSLGDEFCDGRLSEFSTVELNPLILAREGPKIVDVLLLKN
jgi:acyl-CoA synthetase (NDP forming)